MAWDDWERIKAGVTPQHDARMRLNQLAPAGGGGGSTPDLASSPKEKQAAAKAISQDLEPGVARHGKHAAESVKAVVKEFGARDGYGWDSSGALKKAQETWEKQVKTLLDRLAAEQSALSTAAVGFRNNELGLTSQFARRSRIDGA